MISRLFARLTNGTPAEAALFEALVAHTRQPHWHVEGEVPDTVDGRFAVLATVVALATVWLEGRDEPERSAALAERFIAAMDAEHRQMGVSDPAIGKTVRRLVGSLVSRVALWREATAGGDWAAATRQSIYRQSSFTESALAHSVARLRELWQRLNDGRIG